MDCFASLAMTMVAASAYLADAANWLRSNSRNQFADFLKPPNGNRWNPAIDAVLAGGAA